MELLNLGKVPWLESQSIYHALATLGRETLVLLSPSTPYVCIGFHQDLEQEVDVDFCRKNDIHLLFQILVETDADIGWMSTFAEKTTFRSSGAK